jgi:hypothetical protein
MNDNFVHKDTTHPSNKTRHIPKDNNKIFKHHFYMALKPGDVLVLATDFNDEQNKVRPTLSPIEMFYVEDIRLGSAPSWEMSSTASQSIKGSISEERIHPVLWAGLRTPLKVIQRDRGNCTLFKMAVGHGYRLHYLDYVKTKLPSIYSQLLLS